MKAIVLLSLIALSLGALTQLELTEASLISSVDTNPGDGTIEGFLEFLGQVTNQTNFVSDLETVWNETVAGQRNDTNFNNLIQESKSIFGESATVLLQDILEIIYSGNSNAAIEKTLVDLSLFLFPGSDSMNTFLRDALYTGLDWIDNGALNLTNAQNVLTDVLEGLNINASVYETEVQEVIQVINNHLLQSSQDQDQSSNIDIVDLINSLAQIFNNETNLEDIAIQDILEIANQSISGQLNITLIKTLIEDASNLLIEEFTPDETVIQDAVQTINDIMSLPTINTSNIFNIVTSVGESLVNTYISDLGLNASTFSATPIVSSAQILIQASMKLLENTTGPESLISDTLEIISEVLSSDHFNVTDIIPLIEGAFELVANDTKYAGVIQGFTEILNDIASGQEINVENLVEDITEAFADIAFGNSSYFNNAIQDLILIIQGQANTTDILNFALNTAQVVADVTGYSGPIEDGINIVEDITSGKEDSLNMVENGAELIGDLTGYGEFIQTALNLVEAITSGDPLAFLGDLVKLIEDITGIASVVNIVEDTEMLLETAKVLDILSSSDISQSDVQTLAQFGLEIFGKVTNTGDLMSDLTQVMQDFDSSNEEGNFDLVIEDGASIAHDLESLNVVNPNQGNMKTIVEDMAGMIGMTSQKAYFEVNDMGNVYNSLTSGNITKEIFIENIITIIEDVKIITTDEFNPTDYFMHSLIANVFEIINGYTSGQLTADLLLEDIALIAADIFLVGLDKSSLQQIPVQDIAQVLKDYEANDIQSLVEDTIDVLTLLNIINPDARYLPKAIATTVAIDQYTANASQGNAMDNGEEALFY